MKLTIIKYSALILFLMMWACNEPAPTELLYEDKEQLDIQILADPTLFNDTNDFDSTGIRDTKPPQYANIITVNGIKTTLENGNTTDHYYASAQFYNKDAAVYSPMQQLLGYGMRRMGMVSFGGRPAKEVPRILRYRFNGMEKDTLLGVYYELRQMHGPMHQRLFPYNSSIEFSVRPQNGNNEISFQIPTPEEIIGRINVHGSKATKNFGIVIEWNALSRQDSIDIVIGGAKMGDEIEPFFRILRVVDDGSLTIEPQLLRNIPFDRFRSLVISLERTKKLRYSGGIFNDNLITGKSIHNIKFNVP